MKYKNIIFTICLMIFVRDLNAQNMIINTDTEIENSKTAIIDTPHIKYKNQTNLRDIDYNIENKGRLKVSDTLPKSVDKAQIYFMSYMDFGGPLRPFRAFKIFIDNEFVCKVKKNKYSIHEVSAGEHTIAVQLGGKKQKMRALFFMFNIQKGKTYYFEVGRDKYSEMYSPQVPSDPEWEVIYNMLGLIKLYCREITELLAKNLIEDLPLDLDTKCL